MVSRPGPFTRLAIGVGDAVVDGPAKPEERRTRLAERLLPGSAAFAGIGAFLGHLFPVWLKFSGGKGVATLLGIILGFVLVDQLSWAAALCYAVVWLAALGITRYSSVGGMSAALAAPAAAAVLGRFDLALIMVGFALLVLWKHRANIARLVAGTEPRVGQGG